MVSAALYLIATEGRDALDIASGIAGVVVAILGVLAVIGGVVRWVTVHAIGDAVTEAVKPLAAQVTELQASATRLDVRLTDHLDSEDEANEAWAKDWASFREQHTEDVRTLHARIDQALARAVHPSNWGLTHADDDE